MKNKKILILSIIVNIVFLLIICIFISGDKNIMKERQVIKEMTSSTIEANLNAQITQLNKSHTDYANSIEESKKKIASAITDMGIETSDQATAETMASNIKSIGTKNGESLIGKCNFRDNVSFTVKNNGYNTLTIILESSRNQTLTVSCGGVTLLSKWYGDTNYSDQTYTVDISSYLEQNITFSSESGNINTNWLNFNYTLS